MTALKQYTVYDGKKVPHIVGSKGCFVAGTQITMADGTKKAIENIELGDLVLAFDKKGNLGPANVNRLYHHEDDEFLTIKHWVGEFTVTPNHWLLLEDGLFLEAGKFTEEDQVVTYDGKLSPIESIEYGGRGESYNFTVSQQHTYIANDVRVHNKGGGGGKGGGNGGGAVEDPNDKFSTDILFITSGLGEGPVYRVNPNGPQDIEVQDGNIDDLINIEGDGLENTDLFKTLSNSGTVTQPALRVFGQEIATPQNLTSKVPLKKGNVAGIPESKIELQSTTNFAWDALRFNFELRGLINQDDRGNIHGHKAQISIDVFNNTGTEKIMDTVKRTIEGKTNVIFKFDVSILIPDDKKDDQGYKFTIKKTSDDSDSSKIHDNIAVRGWTEIEYTKQAYPRTAHIGYAIKAHSEHTSGIPNFTSIVKGLLVKVPSNYNQPILETGEIDWRELEVVDGDSSTTNAYQREGYSLQFSGPGTKLTTDNPQLYIGTWDGTFVYNWSQNPVWIVYDLLTNATYGLGIPEGVIDKFKFYQTAMYCDACNADTGRFEGITALADGSWRHKPRGTFTSTRENQFGLADSTKIVERRFTCDVTIADQGQAMDVINQITSIFRGALVYNMGKITLAVDMPNELPVAMFNETNIKDGSFQISGIKENELITSVDLSYIEPTNHYKRETVRIDTVDRNDGIDKSALENLATLDLLGVTRRSQALRYAHYQIAASQYLRRRVQFTTSIEAISLSPGDVISVSQQMTGLGLGYGGKISSNSIIAGGGANAAQVHLEYFTEPTLPSTFFTANTDPLAMRIFKQSSDRVDLYLLSNTDYDLITTTKSYAATANSTVTANANVNFGIDLANVKVTHQFNVVTKTFDAISKFPANAAPVRGDLWMLGEMTTTSDVYTNKAGKLFKITSITRNDDHEVSIEGMEYISNVYVDSDTFIDYTPTAYTDITSPFVPPPAPDFILKPLPRRTADGSVVVDVLVDTFTEREDYRLNFSTDYFVSLPEVVQKVANVTSVPGVHPPTFKLGNSAGLTDSLVPAILTGKNGFSGTTGELKLLCTEVSESAAGSGQAADSHIELALEGLNVAFDYNFSKHILDVNDGGQFPQAGRDYISFPANEKANTGAEYGFVGHNPRTALYSAEILSHNSNGLMSTAGYYALQDNVIVKNTTSDDGTKLFDAIPTPPFYVSINQLLDSRYYTNKNFYVSGTEMEYSRSNSVTLVAPVAGGTSLTSHVEPLEIVPRHKNFIKAFVDGSEISSESFNLHKGEYPANVEFTELTADASKVRVVIDHYTVPTIEVGDNVQFITGNVFSVIATSYDNTQPAISGSNVYVYNHQLTANGIYTITLAGTPTANVGGTTFINISPDITGSLGNVSGSSFTLDYNTLTYPGNHNLANNGIYSLALGSPYDQVYLTQDRTLPSVRMGPISVKARNRNYQNRTSPFNVKTLILEEIPIRKVQDISVTEELFIDTNKGVSIRAIIAFDHIQGQEVSDYEISYKLTGETPDLTSFNTVKVAAAGVDTDDKIRFSITNVNRGSSAGKNSLIVRITALNKEIRGITAEHTHVLQGKTGFPSGVSGFSVGQSTDQITLTWTFPEPRELDIQEVVVRRIVGSVAVSEENWILSSPLVSVADNVNRKSVPIDSYGQYTYLIKTKDTSGNFSEDLSGYVFTTVKGVADKIIAAFNEDSPGSNFTTITNTNSTEQNYPSFSNSISSGLVFDRVNDGSIIPNGTASLLADNANASSTGWSAASSITDLDATTNAVYITQFRDMGTSEFYGIELDREQTQVPKLDYTDFKTTIHSDASELQAGTPKANVLKATGIATHMQSANVYYDSNNATLVDNASPNITQGQNVLAIWNTGQYPGNVLTVMGITKASPAVITTHYLSNGESNGNTHCIGNTSAPGARFIIHDAEGMTQINDKELYAKRLTNITLAIYTDKNLTTALDTSSGYDTYTGGAVVDQGDYANSNSYALIAGIINTNHIELGASYYANGLATGSNAFSNVTVAADEEFHLVDLRDYDDVDVEPKLTFQGSVGAIDVKEYIRTSTAANIYVDNYSTGQNSNVLLSTLEGYDATSDEDQKGTWKAFEPGEQQFRWLQLKLEVTNSRPDENDFTLDKFRYTISRKEQTFEETVNYGTRPITLDWSSKNFREVPYVQTDPPTIPASLGGLALLPVAQTITTTGGTFRLYKTDGTEMTASSDVTVKFKVTGV